MQTLNTSTFAQTFKQDTSYAKVEAMNKQGKNLTKN